MKDCRLPAVSWARRVAFPALLAAAVATGAPAPALASTADDWAGIIESTLSDPSYSATGYDHGDETEAAALSDGDEAVPEGDGAWLVKNSWGSGTEDFPNDFVDKEFGIEEDDKHTGYFWISCYDRSLEEFEAFEFDLTECSASEQYVVDQYDYMASAEIFSLGDDEKCSSANIYRAEEDMPVRALSCMTAKPNTMVDYKLYLLDDDAATTDDPEYPTLVYEISSEEYRV